MSDPTVSELLLYLEATWALLQQHHADLPATVLVMASSTEGRPPSSGLVLGHFARSRWEFEDGRTVGEVFLAAENLRRGADELLDTLIHEAAHALCHARGIKGTSRRGQYHNKRYKAVAIEMGLTYAEDTPGLAGWNRTELGQQARERYADVLQGLDQRIRAVRVPPDAPKPRTPPTRPTVVLDTHTGQILTQVPTEALPAELGDGQEGPQDAAGAADGDPQAETGEQGRYVQVGGTRLLLACACPSPRKLRVSPLVAQEGPILCGVCGEPFTVQF